MSERITMSPPWIGFFRKIEALFKEDPEITIRYIEDPITIKLYVNNQAKAEALSILLPKSRTFGGVTAYVQVVPSNIAKDVSNASLFKTAFEGNPVFDEMIDVEGVFINPIHYCVFRKEVVQYWDDNLADPNGNISTLYQALASDIFSDTDTKGVIFCTGEW